jgi:hypothetical protein
LRLSGRNRCRAFGQGHRPRRACGQSPTRISWSVCAGNVDLRTLADKNQRMKAHTDMEINGKTYRKGTPFSGYMIYGFFLVHMLAFGLSGFFMAYMDDGPDISFLYMHGGFAILVYLIFYLAIFGVDEVKWMLINAALGLFGIYAQINLILAMFGKHAGDYPWYVHVIPFMYYVLYTFLLYQLVLEITGAHENPQRRKLVEGFYVAVSISVYTTIYLFT